MENKYSGKLFLALFEYINDGYLDLDHLNIMNAKSLDNDRNLYNIIMLFANYYSGDKYTDMGTAGTVPAYKFVNSQAVTDLINPNLNHPNLEARKACFKKLCNEFEKEYGDSEGSMSYRLSVELKMLK